VATIKEKKIRTFIVDPFVRSHEVNENDNAQIDKIVWCFQQIIERTNCAIGIVHHARKLGIRSETGDADSSRGASALINAARIAHSLTEMKESEAEKYGIELKRSSWFCRLDSAKANLNAPDEHCMWYEKETIFLPNGDAVGGLKVASLSDVQTALAKEEQLAEIQDLANCLNELMVPGQKMNFNEVMAQVVNDPTYSFLFEYKDKTEKTKREWLLRLTKRKIVINGKRFSYFNAPASRPRHWVTCEADCEAKEPDFLS